VVGRGADRPFIYSLRQQEAFRSEAEILVVLACFEAAFLHFGIRKNEFYIITAYSIEEKCKGTTSIARYAGL
jgi:hypothetical protein